jgi:S1-C subfamily serine protease
MEDVVTQESILAALSDALAAQAAVGAARVVHVRSRGHRPGSGTIVGADLVLTTDRAVEHEDGLRVADGTRELGATLVGRDPLVDLALLRIDGLDAKVTGLTERVPALGELVVGVWRNWRGGAATAPGVVAALSGPVEVGHGTRIEQLARTSIAPARGVSGGVLLDARGNAIGILHGGFARGFVAALPASVVRATVEALAAHGHIPRGFLGVGLQRIRLAPSQREAADTPVGLLIVGLEDDGPAAGAGALTGDIIVSVGGQKVRDVADVHGVLTPDRIGKVLPLDVVRGGEVRTLDVTVGARPR